MSRLTEKSTIVNFKPSKYRHLCRLLDIGAAWKDLAEVIPSRRNPAEPRFSMDDIQYFAMDQSPSERLLNAWKTDNVTFGDLIRSLTNAELLRQAAYVRQLVEPSSTVVVEIAVDAPAAVDHVLPPPSLDQINLCVESGVCHISYQMLSSWTNKFDGGSLVGQGGFADVFKGCDKATGRTLAIKRSKDTLDLQTSKKQFENEIDVMFRCSHENLVKLVGYSTDGPMPCLVEEFMMNGSLESCLRSETCERALSASQRLMIAQDVAHGVVYIHDQNLIHRDIKSANVLLDDSMRAKLGDFGITRTGPSRAGTAQTSTRVITGTTAYMAPEYLLDGKVSFKTDSFSYGVVLLELLTGLAAYDTRREEYTLLEHMRENWDDRNVCKMADKKIVGFSDKIIVKKIYDVAMQLCDNVKFRPLIRSILIEIESWSVVETTMNDDVATS